MLSKGIVVSQRTAWGWVAQTKSPGRTWPVPPATKWNNDQHYTLSIVSSTCFTSPTKSHPSLIFLWYTMYLYKQYMEDNPTSNVLAVHGLQANKNCQDKSCFKYLKVHTTHIKTTVFSTEQAYLMNTILHFLEITERKREFTSPKKTWDHRQVHCSTIFFKTGIGTTKESVTLHHHTSSYTMDESGNIWTWVVWCYPACSEWVESILRVPDAAPAKSCQLAQTPLLPHSTSSREHCSLTSNIHQKPCQLKLTVSRPRSTRRGTVCRPPSIHSSRLILPSESLSISRIISTRICSNRG